MSGRTQIPVQGFVGKSDGPSQAFYGGFVLENNRFYVSQ